jgi:hypothetical protein
MQELMQLLENRQSARGLFDPERAISSEHMVKILEAARWAADYGRVQWPVVPYRPFCVLVMRTRPTNDRKR